MTTAAKESDGDMLREILSLLRTGAVHPPVIPLIDPTANVKEALAGAVKRVDDIRDRDNDHARELRNLEERCGKEVSDLKEKLAQAETRRIDASNLAESRRVDAVLAEQKAAVALASEKSAAQATALDARASASAEALRAGAASANAALDMRITRLEQSQYQIGGRDQQRDTQGAQANATKALWIGLIVTVVIAAVGWGITILYLKNGK